MGLSSLDFYKRFGVPDVNFQYKQMMTLKVPEWITNNIPKIPKRIFCNKQMEVPLLVAFYNIIDRDLEHDIIKWEGCFNVRPIRGYEENHKQAMLDGNLELAMKYMSVHSWGCAIDINPKENPLGKKGKMSDELGGCFEDAGFTWGKHFSRADFMHFQLEYLR